MKIGFYAPCNEYNRKTGPLLGIAYMAAYLQAELGIEDIYLEVDLQKALERKPDLLAISAFSEKYGQVSRELTQVRQDYPDLPLVLGGPHISAMPQSLNPAINVGVIGEGEKPMAAMVQLLLQEGRLSPEGLKDIQNLVYWDEQGQLQRTVFEDRIKDLDSLPLPRRDVMQAWWPSLQQQVVFDRGVYTSRGCSFRCHFCMYSERANLIRYVSIDKVMEDILAIMSQYPEQQNIIFYDDLFVTKKSRLKELSDAIRSEGLHKRVSFGCMAKTSFFDAEFAAILRDMNMRMISWGFESGADPVLQYLKDRHATVYKHQQALDIAHRYGIMSGGYFIIGAPPENWTQLAQTYWFISNNLSRMPLIGIYPVIPLPGTSLWQETAERGLIDDSFQSWENMGFLDLGESYLHLNQHYSKADFKQAYDNWFSRLMQWPNIIFPEILDRFQQQRLVFPEVISQLKGLFTPATRVLEVHAEDPGLSFELESHFAYQGVYWQHLAEIEALDPTEIDLVVVSLTLEKFGLDAPQWQALLALKRPIYLVFEQVGFLSHLQALLQGKFPATLEGMDMFSPNYRYTLKSLKPRLAEQGLALQHMTRFSLPLPAEQQMQLKAVMEYLFSHLPVHDYLVESTTFAYGLLLAPVLAEKSEPSRLLAGVQVEQLTVSEV